MTCKACKGYKSRVIIVVAFSVSKQTSSSIRVLPLGGTNGWTLLYFLVSHHLQPPSSYSIARPSFYLNTQSVSHNIVNIKLIVPSAFGASCFRSCLPRSMPKQHVFDHSMQLMVFLFASVHKIAFARTGEGRRKGGREGGGGGGQ